jgi:hypothetical protein
MTCYTFRYSPKTDQVCLNRYSPNTFRFPPQEVSILENIGVSEIQILQINHVAYRSQYLV